MKAKKFNIVALGEVLWDKIEDRYHLGGAPFNLAYHASQLGCSSEIITRVGNDPLGDRIIKWSKDLGIGTSGIQIDENHLTGTVEVTLDASGNPDFKIAEQVAYDYIQLTDEARQIVKKADAVVFGTQCQRAPTSRRTIQALLQLSGNALRVCDVNLRAPYFDRELAAESLGAANMLQLNLEEMVQLQELFARPKDDRDSFLKWLQNTFKLDVICLTLAAQGCMVRSKGEIVTSPGRQVEVADTVGAGAAFAAAFLVQYLRGQPLQECADFANTVAAFVVSQPGGTPEFSEEFRQELA